jgi:F420-non-reducing hydrogenase iron-sulfur subunit
MCGGRIDMVHMIRPFLLGADGIFVGTCLPGECHYTSGNDQAMARTRLVRMILEQTGLNPDRLVMKMMSSAEGPKFVQYVTQFVQSVKEIGPLGKAEGVDEVELQLKLTAALHAVEGKKVRWVAGKRFEFTGSGNLYGETFTDHEIGRMFQEVVADECALQEMLLRLNKEPMTAKDLAHLVQAPTRVVVRRLADLLRLRLVEISDNEGSPLWKARERDEATTRQGDTAR